MYTTGRSRSSLSHSPKDLSVQLPKVFFSKELRQKIETLSAHHRLSGKEKARLGAKAQPLKLAWNVRAISELYTFTTANIEPLEILEAWSRFEGAYLSHGTALYLHNLIEQRPKDHFISREIPGKRGTRTSKPLSEFVVKQAFLKLARHTQQFFSYQAHRYYIIEKVPMGEPGVEILKVRQRTRTLTLKVTNLERTLIDVTISPHYAGGIVNVLSAYKDAKISIDTLHDYYQALNLVYPYWQSLGYLLQNAVGSREATAWRKKFAKQKMQTFYLDHGYRNNWRVDPTWRVYVPPNIQ